MADRSNMTIRRLPRVLILDVTRIGSRSATGQIKSRLFAGWPQDKLLQVFSTRSKIGVCRGQGHKRQIVSKTELERILQEYAPEVIYARPVDAPAYFTNLTWRIVEVFGDVPIVTHIMDDWLTRIKVEEPHRYAIEERHFRRLVERSTHLFSISSEMAVEMSRRYRKDFEPFANCLDLSAFPRREADTGEPFTLIYSGSFADDQCANSLKEIAEAVERIGATRPILLKIAVISSWLEAAQSSLSEFSYTQVQRAGRDWDQYMAFLAEGDVGIIAYNFDERTRAYVRLSLANKLPEYFAASLPVLAYGPEDFATISRCQDSGASIVVSERDPRSLQSAIENLMDNPTSRETLSQIARNYAEDNFDATDVRTRFQERLLSASATKKPKHATVLPIGEGHNPLLANSHVATRGTVEPIQGGPAGDGATKMSRRQHSRKRTRNSVTKRLLEILPRWLVERITPERRDRWRGKLFRLERRLRRAGPATASREPAYGDDHSASVGNFPLGSVRSALDSLTSQMSRVEVRLDDIIARLDQLDSRVSMHVSGPAPSPVDDLRDLIMPVQVLIERLDDLDVSSRSSEPHSGK